MEVLHRLRRYSRPHAGGTVLLVVSDAHVWGWDSTTLMHTCSPETKNRTLEEIKEIFVEPLRSAEVIREGGETKVTVGYQEDAARKV